MFPSPSLGVVVAFPQPAAPKPRWSSPESLLDFAKEGLKEDSPAGLRRALREYSTEEIALIGKMKGGLTLRDRMIKRLKEMFPEDIRHVLASFVGSHKTAVMERQINMVTQRLVDNYNEAFKQLGVFDELTVKIDFNGDDGKSNVVIKGI